MLGLQPVLFLLVGHEQGIPTAASSFFPIVPRFHHCFLPSSFQFFCPGMYLNAHYPSISWLRAQWTLLDSYSARSLLGTPEVLVSFFCPPCTYCHSLAYLDLTIARTPQDNWGLGKCFLKELIMDEGVNPFIKDFLVEYLEIKYIIFPFL